jgi:biotin synthase
MELYLSSGSAVRLGLLSQKTAVEPRTIYMMTGRRCSSSCAFCPQSRAKQRLSRVAWHPYHAEEVVGRLEGSERVCIQATSHEGVHRELASLLSMLPSLPISLSIPPLEREKLAGLTKADRISVNLDCAAETLFAAIKKGCSWESTWHGLEEAVCLWGRYNVISHLIVGLGETEEEMARCMQVLFDRGILPSLFAFTPLANTPLEKRERPPLSTYRRMQLARFLIVGRLSRAESMEFSDGGLVDFGIDVGRIRENPEVYVTAGCPHCDRPYYTETVRLPYNFPRPPSGDEMAIIQKQF